MPERYLGQTIGERYRLTRLLGAGAYAWVYEAVDAELEIAVAVKVLKPDLASDEKAQTRFRREATTAARLRHPNIVTVRDVGSANGITWVTMDLLPTSLARRLQVMPYLPEADVIRVGLDVAAALTIAHSDNVIHRDIKPDNILISPTGEAVVCDFGLARALSATADLSATNQVLGTPHYFSPEQARGEQLDGRSDLYTLGVTLYRASTGKLPFEGEDWYSVARKHVDETPAPPRSHVASISPGLEAIILKLLAKKPEDRFASAAFLADALAQLPSAPSTGSRLALGAGGTTTTHTIKSKKKKLAGRTVLVVGSVCAIVAAWLSMGAPGGNNAWALLNKSAPNSDSIPTDSLADSLAQQSDLLDSIANAAADSADSVKTLEETPKPSPNPSRRLASLSVFANSDSTILNIDGKPVGYAPWEIESISPGQHIVGSALIGGAGVFAGCRYNERTDTVSLKPGENAKLSVNLARCTRVWMDVTPRDARISFVDEDGFTVLTGSAERISPAVLKAGVWRLKAEARACAPFEALDTLSAGGDTVKVVLLCD